MGGRVRRSWAISASKGVSFDRYGIGPPGNSKPIKRLSIPLARIAFELNSKFIRITGQPTRVKSKKPRMHSIFIRFSQYVEAALRRIVSLSQDARGPPDAYVLSSVRKCSRCWLPASDCFCRLKAPLEQVIPPFDRSPHSRTSRQRQRQRTAHPLSSKT